jgi:hypothetical protein
LCSIVGEGQTEETHSGKGEMSDWRGGTAVQKGTKLDTVRSFRSFPVESKKPFFFLPSAPAELPPEETTENLFGQVECSVSDKLEGSEQTYNIMITTKNYT